MSLWQILLLICAGLLGGLANAIAGGASLFTFPAMLATGLSPIAANATNSLALLPGNSLGAFADRAKLPERDRMFWLGNGVAVLGGLSGALLLLRTSPALFELLVPALIGTATLIFIFSAQIRVGLKSLFGGEPHPALRQCLIFLAAVYNGFFGAGVGVIFIAVLVATGNEDLRTSNAFKNVLGFISNLGGIAIYAFSGVISLPHGFTMMIGTTMGGLLGGKLVQVLPSWLVRSVISAAGMVMTATYVYRFWL